MAVISDVNVTIDVQNPAPLIGLGLPLILTPVAADGTPTYKEYADIDAVKVDYDSTTGVYGKARDFSAQANAGTPVAVQTYTEGSADDAMDNCFDKAWHFAMVAGGAAADTLAIAKYIEAKNFKFAAVQVADPTGITAYGPTTDGNGNVTAPGLKRTIVVVHATVGENLDAALIGDAGSLTVGSITWKFRKNLVGITPDVFSTDQIKAMHKAGGVTYVVKSGIPQMTEGITAAGEFIDALHGDDWVKINMENDLQTFLMNANKVSYDQHGISQLASVMEGTLKTAFLNGIIDKDPLTNLTTAIVSAPQITDIPRATVVTRILSGLTFDYTRQSAIHEVNVHGTVVA
ncbi:MAG: DUF3383 family protein [Sporolactobacillus sp.]